MKQRSIFKTIKNIRAKSLEWLMIAEDKYGYLHARLFLLTTAFLLSTVMTLLIFLISGIIYYIKWIPLFFVFSNLVIMYHIVKPYLMVMNRWLED